MEPTNTSYPITTHTPNVQLTQNHQSFQLIYRSTRLRRKKTDESEPKPYKREIPSGQPRRIHAFRRSTPIQPRRVESMPMGTSRYFVRRTTIPPPKRPRRIHVSPCHDTPILFGDEVKRCPWGHLGNIMRTSYIPPPLGLEESMSAHA